MLGERARLGDELRAIAAQAMHEQRERAVARGLIPAPDGALAARELDRLETGELGGREARATLRRCGAERVPLGIVGAQRDQDQEACDPEQDRSPGARTRFARESSAASYCPATSPMPPAPRSATTSSPGPRRTPGARLIERPGRILDDKIAHMRFAGFAAFTLAVALPAGAPAQPRRRNARSARCASRRRCSRSGSRSGSTRSCPALMRKHGIDLWVVPMREYNEDPVFAAITSPRDVRRPPPHDLRVLRQVRGRAASRPRPRASSGSPSAARRRAACSRRVAPPKRRPETSGRGQQAELWGDEQWQVLEERRRRAQAEGDRHRSLDSVRVLRRPLERRAAGDERARSARSGRSAIKNAEGAAARADRRRGCRKRRRSSARMQELVWSLTQEMFSERSSRRGRRRTSDLVWWWRQRVNDLGLGTWFQP